MNIRIVFMALIACQTCFAQENNGERPSWSQGLPERNAAPAVVVQKPLSAPRDVVIDREAVETSRPEMDQEPMVLEPVDMFEYSGNNMPFKPAPSVETESEYSDQLVTDGDLKSVVEADVEVEPVEDVPINTESNVTVQKAVVKQEPATSQAENHVYQWEVVRMVPVQLPRSLAQEHSSVLLKVSIDDAGRVTEVNSVLDQTPQSVMMHATRYVKMWRFDAPKNHNINHGLSRVFKVSLQARS